MNLRRAARYMGCPQPDESVYALLRKGEAILRESAQPRHVIRRVAVQDFPLPGEAIRRHLAGCREMLLIAATLGVGMDERIRRESLMDMALGLSVNACAAAYLEELLDELPLPLAPGEYATPRFSPGYGDLPLTVQTEFLLRVDGKAIGLWETAAHMLTPEKSVTALCGVTAFPQAHCPRRCQGCPSAACPFREV